MYPKSELHGFEEKTKYHVPGYMDLKKKQNTRVHGFEEFWNFVKIKVAKFKLNQTG